MPSATNIIALALGSNLGNRLAALRDALTAIAPYFNVAAKSAIYETPPLYITDQPAFLNAAITGATKLEPAELLRALKQSETQIGRAPSFRYGPRLIDIDILFYGEHRLATPELELPHPRLADREFVLRPLADIEPAWRHPTTRKSVKDMLAALPNATAKKIPDTL